MVTELQALHIPEVRPTARAALPILITGPAVSGPLQSEGDRRPGRQERDERHQGPRQVASELIADNSRHRR
jgi:hypothetical protein